MIGVEEETLPHKKTIINVEDISEERRLCYVGITRAQEKLYMTYCKNRKIYGKETPRNKSRFLFDLGKNDLFIEQDRTTFGHLTTEEAEEYKKSFLDYLLSQVNKTNKMYPGLPDDVLAAVKQVQKMLRNHD